MIYILLHHSKRNTKLCLSILSSDVTFAWFFNIISNIILSIPRAQPARVTLSLQAEHMEHSRKRIRHPKPSGQPSAQPRIKLSKQTRKTFSCKESADSNDGAASCSKATAAEVSTPPATLPFWWSTVLEQASQRATLHWMFQASVVAVQLATSRWENTSLVLCCTSD